MNKKKVEKHVTLLEADHTRLKRLAKVHRRTMRQMVNTLIDEALEKMEK